MKKINTTYFILVLGLLAACSSAKKTVVSEEENQKLESFLKTSPWEIQSDQASPMATNSFMVVANSGLLPPGNNAGFINLVNNPNYFRKRGDSISLYLPYFGERRIGGSYGGTSTAIQFEGVPRTFEIRKNERKRRWDIFLEVNDTETKTELYTINISVFPNKRSTINVISSQRTNISYSGIVKELDL